MVLPKNLLVRYEPTLEVSSNQVGSCLTHKFWSRLERLATDKPSSLFGLVIRDEEKSLIRLIAWRMGWAMTMSSTQFVSMVACMAISKPMKMRVPRPKTIEKMSNWDQSAASFCSQVEAGSQICFATFIDWRKLSKLNNH
jgi:hypothetical protein